MMQIKAQYLAGLVEYEFGQDPLRAQSHFLRFTEISSLFSKHRLRQEYPEYTEVAASIGEY